MIDFISTILEFFSQMMSSVYSGPAHNPLFFVAAVGSILVIERLMPADTAQPVLSVGFLQDCVWSGLTLIFQGFVTVVYVQGLERIYLSNFSYLTHPAVHQWPGWLRFLFAVLLVDLAAWIQHWLKHKIPWFWQMHAVHHSQPQMNLFTDLRRHFLELFILRSFSVVPLFILGVDTIQVGYFGIFMVWQTRFYHANIKWNMGWLRYIFVTPQSHRIHHSIELRHQDKNLGVMFSFWDRLFGTQYDLCEEYPVTGISDRGMPLEKNSSPLSLAAVPIKQLAYPFWVIGKDLRGRR